MAQLLGGQLVHGQEQKHWLADNATPFITDGETKLCVKIGNMETTVLASVARTLSCGCILGVDWIWANNVSILTHENRIVLFNQHGVAMDAVGIDSEEHRVWENSVAGTSSIQLKPNIGQIIEGLVPNLEDMEQRAQLRKLLNSFGTIFDLSIPTTATPAMFHTINTGSAQPIAQRPRIQSTYQRAETEKHVEAMLAAGQIVPSNSPWAAPVHIVKKPDGSSRFTVDYRKLNSVTVKDNYPLPSIAETINQLQGYSYYTKMDLKSGYLQIPISEEDQPKSAFITKEGLYHFKVLPAGLKNAPPTFQRIMNTIIARGREQFCLIYLDDIIVFSKSFSEHLEHVGTVLRVLYEHHFQLNPPKCDFFKSTMNYLGHTISTDGMKPLDERIETIKQLPMPTTLRAANYFIGKLGFYRKFIRNFAQMAAPIHRITNLHKGRHREFTWGDEQVNAFNQLKQAISTEPLVLKFPDSNSPLVLSTDASDIGIGGVLKQITPEGTRIIYYHSQLLNSAQKRYATIEKEALAVFKSVEKLRPYLLGRDFVIETDHCPLCNFHQRGSRNRRVDTWAILLSEYNIQEVRYKKGKCNCDADLLSRYPVGIADDEEVEDQAVLPNRKQINVLTRAAANRIKRTKSVSSTTVDHDMEHNDELLQQAEQNCEQTEARPLAIAQLSPLDLVRIGKEQQNDERIQQHLQNPLEGMVIQDGILYHRRKDKNGQKMVPYIPKSLVNDVLAAAHDHQFSAHFGRDKTFEKLKTRCFWPNMYLTIQNYVKRCQDCIRFNTQRCKPSGHLQSIEPPAEIFQMVGLDFWGPVRESSNGNKYVLVLTDYLSKFVVAKALPACTAQLAAEFVVETALTFGVPSQLLTDNGTHFKNDLFQCLSKIIGFNHILSTPYHPQTNGQTERWNATMRPKLAMLCQSNQDNWDGFLGGVVHAYNTSVHATTGYSPSFLMFGREIPLAFDAAKPILQLSTISNYVEHLSRYRKLVLAMANSNARQHQQMAKQKYDQHRQAPVYEIGQLVFMKRRGYRDKFGERYSGPFRIIDKLDENHLTYLVQNDHQPTQYQVHINDLITC
ncbi:unnamed protein product [Adineta ricciae]|uniref:Reverse transcriptase n=1 Tax=Adineta ricciae TaxID=249248 RepID=A0A814LQF8_ADIRI|nr:unnamed protein product [Adineta ricciae]CAF1461164.1 unnamed protein product [Adineta ricciae]